MTNETKSGTHWQNEELDAIVADYFAMLVEDLSGRAYVKSVHSKALMARLDRSHRSVEFKHQNISAVLDELGMPWIPGYKPKWNYQNAIFDAIDRYLSVHPATLVPDQSTPSPPPLPDEIFVAPPILAAANKPIIRRLQRLVQKFDPVERDRCNRSLGRAGEAFVVDLEKRRLAEGDRADLAKKVRWVAAEDGDGAGYDVLSFNLDSQPRLIEVKTTNGSARTPFFLTRGEVSLAAERSKNWLIYRVHLFNMRPRIFTITPPLETSVKLTPETWRASF